MKTPKNANSFPERLKRLMEKRGLTQEAVAGRMGLASSSVSRWLAGSTPRPDAVKKLANILGVNAEWLATGRGLRDPAEGFASMLSAFSEVARQYEPKNPEVLLDRLIKSADPFLDTLHEKADAAEVGGGEWKKRAQLAEKTLAQLRREMTVWIDRIGKSNVHE